MPTFDIEEIMNDKSLNDLNWGVIEARGFPCGDLALLYELAIDLVGVAAEAIENAEIAEEGYRETRDPLLFVWSRMFKTLASFSLHDAHEVVKFIYGRGFIFPE